MGAPLCIDNELRGQDAISDLCLQVHPTNFFVFIGRAVARVTGGVLMRKPQDVER